MSRSWMRNPRSLRFKSLALTIGAIAAALLLSGEHRLKTALVLLPMGVLVAWWTGRRMVRPLERLREQVLLRAQAATPRAGLSLGRKDEFGDLSDAFDSLLHALDKRAKATEHFVADVAHELKNPIAALRAAAEMLATTPLDANQAQRLAQNMQASCTRLDQRVSELLELARVEAGLPERQRVDLVQLARGLIDGLRQTYPDREFRLSAPASVTLEVAPTRFESALRNLLDNAASFAGANGWVALTITPDVTIQVSDSGAGISQEHLGKVFDRFFSTRSGGTGLGLALTRAIIEAHGGTLSVAAPAIFTASLPVSHSFHTA